MLYLDHLATTPCAPEVIEAMCRILREDWGNPSSAHPLGWQARERVEEARASLARLLKVRPQRVTLTSGATEATHIALTSAAQSIPEPERSEASLLTQVSEHSATLGPMRALSSQMGATLRVAPIDERGQLDVARLEPLLDRTVRLVSVMHVNNELGVIQPIEELCALVRARAHPECLIHVDGAQAVGKISVNLSELDVDLYSLSAHKFYGPKGVGALCTWLRGSRAHEQLPQVLFGGGQERGVRPGTVATHQAVGLGVAAGLIIDRLSLDQAHSQALERRLLGALRERGAALTVTGPRVAGALSLRCPEGLYELLSERWAGEVAYSQSSACHSDRGAPSHVLSALGLSAEEASRTIRLCVGRYTRAEELEAALGLLN